jgi:beta-N-acetylhexosaminidase
VGDSGAVRAFTRAAREAGLVVGPRGTRVALLDTGHAPVRAGVTVAVGAPWVLGRSRSRHLVATYGVTPGAMRALVEVLVGERRAPGRLPVRVPGLSREGC